MSKKIFSDAIIAVYEVLVKSGYYPAISITEDEEGEFSVSWYGYDDSLNTLAYWTDENVGIYCSHIKGKTLHDERLNVEDFFNLCYKDD